MMTKRELIAALADLPDDSIVYGRHHDCAEFDGLFPITDVGIFDGRAFKGGSQETRFGIVTIEAEEDGTTH